MRLTELKLIIFLPFLLCACEQWPPHEQEIKDHFFEHEADIRSLRDKLLESKYLSVGESMGVVVHGHYYEGELVEGTVMKDERPSDESEWLEVFKRSEVDGVGREDYESTSVSLSKVYFSGNLTDDTDWSMRYVHDSDLPNRVRTCGDNNPNVRCGSCISKLGDDWWLQYWWSPFPYLPEVEEKRLNGEMSEDEYYKLSFRAQDACFAEGGTFLGETPAK